MDATVVTGLATLGGAEMPAALRAGAAMLLLQFATGATNDPVDTPADRRAAPAKPSPAGLVTFRAARLVALAAGPVGLLLAAAGGLGSLLVGAAGLAVGLLYDLRLKGTAWSWLPCELAAGPCRCSLPVASDAHPVGGRDLVPAAPRGSRSGRNGGLNR